MCDSRGGGIGIEPVYAADVTYDTNSHKLQKDGGTPTVIETLTVGNVTIHGTGDGYGITIGNTSDGTGKYVMIDNDHVLATGSVSSNIIASGIDARMEGGKVVAKNGLYIGYDGKDITKATYDNSRFAVNGENGSFKAANGKFTVSGGGAIMADSLALTGTDGTTNVGKDIKDNKNNIQAVNGKVINIQTDVTSLQTTTGELQTKVGDLTASDTAARKNIISLQKKTVGISEDGNEITTNSLKLRGSGSLEGQEITAAKVKGYDKVVAAVGDTSTEGTLAYNTQKIEFKEDNKVTTNNATYIDGITHAGGVRLADGAVRAKSIVLEEEFANGTVAQATLTREAIVNLNGMTDGKTKIKVADGSEVGGVTFDQGKVTNVVSINDNLKFESDGIYLNKGDQTKQIKIDNDGKIIIGTSSSAYDTNGFYAGGDDYNAAKAAIKSDGSLKATKFAVDGTNGNTTVGGDLTVNGAATFTKETAFANGIKTDTISEKTNDAGVTVDGVVLKDGGITADGNVTTTGDIQGANITATGALKGKTLGIGTNGSEFTVDENGNAAVGGTLGVTGKTTLSDELQVDKTATFGIATGAKTVINGDEVKTGRIETTKTQSSYIGGVTLLNGQITADNMTITGTLDMDNLKVNEKLEVGTYGVTKAGVVTGVTSINDVAVSKQGNGLKIGSATVGDTNPFSSQGYTVDATGNVSAKDITAGKYNGNEITADKKFNGVELNGGNVKATKVTADTITDSNGFTATNGNVAAKNITADNATIAGVSFAAGGNVSGISELTATTIKDGAGTIITGGKVESKTAKIGAINIDNETIEGSFANGLSIEGVKIKDGVMSAVVSIDANKATIGGVNTLDNTGLTVKTGSKVQVGTNTVIEDGSVKVSQKTSLTDQSLQLNDTNKWTQTGGLVADKATVNGIALGTDSKGKATFSDAAGKTTTIDGDKITTGTITADKLLIDKISLGKDGSDNISIDKDGDVTTKGDVTIKGADDDTTVIDGAKATFGKDAANQTVIDKGTISANAKNINGQQAGLTFDETGLTVKGQNAEGKASSFSFNAKTGDNTFTGQDKTTTTINGSSVRSYNSATGAGHLNGATLNLWKDNDNSTYMTAGGVTFTKDGKTTTISGDTITTGTLNVTDIVLGGTMYDTAGKPLDGKLSIGNDGHLRAANGNFDVKDDGTFKNTVGNTTLQTGTTGASMKFDNTAADGGVKSEVAVGKNNATVAAGDKASFVANADNGGSATITGGTQTVTTTDKGTEFKNSAHNTPFEGGNATTTIINGNEITTGKITTDQLVITGKGNADGNGGSIAFGGNGTIKSDINDGTTNGKNTSFETTLDGVNTKVTNGTTTTENKVTAEGNSNTVKQDDTHKSEFNQGLTSIGGVVTNGEIKVAQKLDGATGLLTNGVTDANGSSKLEQSGTGLTYTDSTKPDNATRINSSDVSIGSATEPDKRINLSDLGQIDELDKEIRDNEVYKNNETAVGGINAEAAIRRGEVERLDNRISEEVTRLDGRINDVNDRVNKVGAMAAAIASLKSIGYDPQAPSEFSIGLGQYKGETGVAMGFFHYPNKNFMINVSLSTAGGETMGGIGATWRFGHKSPQKLLEEQREAQAKKELAAAEKYQAAAKLAKEAQERAEYAAKLARQAQVSADNAKAAADATQAKHFGE